MQDQTVEVKFDGRLQRNGDWQAKAKAKARAMTLSELTGRYATDKLDFDLSAQIIAKAGHIDGKAQAALPRGQIYIEPVFVDFGAAPATLEATWKFGIAGGRLDVPQFEIVQNGVMHIAGRATKVMTEKKARLAARLSMQTHRSGRPARVCSTARISSATTSRPPTTSPR
ncbi:hypothetical protein B1992_15405 [Pseudoxanthomonas broegbernensis]|uniref:Uncharacterized protein n=1 Tax=Pseudoxanthomonas broegbernensis TaxID=83619 RepID=A0A7V8K600_9GAMM|nr:hypothetical protein B1992_15405 [Pseudoxanthomonas broegbernensis]